MCLEAAPDLNLDEYRIQRSDFDEIKGRTLETDLSVPTRRRGWWYFTHTELRDEKIVLSADYLPAGTYVYTYTARASTASRTSLREPRGMLNSPARS